MELKTSKRPLSAHDIEKYERYKLLKFWLQSFLAGVPTIVIGFRDDAGNVVDLKALETMAIPRSVRPKGYWDPTACFNFGKTVSQRTVAWRAPHAHSRTHALTRSHTLSHTHSHRRTVPHSRTHACTHPLTHAPTHSRTHARTHALTDARTHARTHALSLTHARTPDALTHLLTCLTRSLTATERAVAWRAPMAAHACIYSTYVHVHVQQQHTHV